MESLTYFRDVKSTPKKLRMYLNEIKKLSPQEALDYLLYSTNKQSKLYYKALHSAIANATNTLKVSPDMLQFKLFTIEEGRKLKRFKAGARGSARPRVKRFSHIKIILVEKGSEVKKEESKKDVKEVAKKEVKKDTKVEKKKVKSKSASTKVTADKKKVTKDTK